METGIENMTSDADRLAAARLALSFLRSFRGPERRQAPMQLLEALAGLTAEQLEQGVPGDRVKFTASELAAALGQRTETAVPTDVARAGRWVRARWKELAALLQELPSLEDMARVEGVPVPWLAKDESAGGRGQRTYYLLDVRAPVSRAATEQSFVPPQGGVTYTLERVEKVRFGLFALLLDAPLTGWRRTLFRFSVFSAAWASIAVWPMYAVWADQPITGAWTGDLFFLAVLVFALWEVAWPLVRAVRRGVVVAPVSAASGDNQVLELSIDGDVVAGHARIRRLALARYTSECPLCGGRITIGEGTGEMRGRLVGLCERAPAEHQWTFDHITRVGAPLRTAAIIAQRSNHAGPQPRA